MALDLIETSPGLGPLMWVSDGTRQRVQAGNLAVYTAPNGVTSPAQYGFRAIDSTGNILFDSLGLVSVNPATQLQDSYAIPIGLSWTEIASVSLPTINHTNVSYFGIATATLNFSEPGGVGDTLMISLTLDCGTPFLNFNAAGNPTNGSVATQVGPFTNVAFVMPTIFWTTNIPDLSAHRISVMAGKTGASFVSNQTRLATLQFGN